MKKERLGNETHGSSIQILDITNHLHTLIRVDYTSATPPSGIRVPSPTRVAKRSAGQKQLQRVLLSRKSTMYEETTWRFWRSKIQNNDSTRPRNFSGEDLDSQDRFNGSARRRAIGYTNGDPNNAMRNRQIKHPPARIYYQDMYNGAIMNNHTHVHDDHRRKYPDDGFNSENADLCDSFKDYCHNCTIHGLKYIGDSTLPYHERLYWIFSFILAIFGAGYFIWHLYTKYSMAPIIISRNIDGVDINQFPFPALTVCNMNNAKKSVAMKIEAENDTLQNFFLEDICNVKSDTSFIQEDIKEEAGDFDNIYNFLMNVSQNCTEMLYYCQWHGNSTSCEEIFNPVLTDEGLCCNFNSVPRILYHPRKWKNLRITYASEMQIDWTPEYTFKKEDSPRAIPWRAYSSGSNYGLTLALDVDADEYYCSSTASVGFKMLLHSPVETPPIADFAFTLSPGKETRVIITPHVTDADKSIIKIPLKIRNCYFLGEKKLKYYRTYTQRNCLSECEANFTLQICHCMQYYMPVSNDTRICGKNDDDCSFRARKAMKEKYYSDDDGDTTRASINFTEIPTCKCYPGCNEINYSTEISHSMLMTTFEIPEEYFKNNQEYFMKNIAVVHIFFIDTSYMKYTKNVLYGFAELLSNTGGLLGLFMGFSLLSVIEMFYYFTMRLWWRIKRKKTIVNEKKNSIVQAFTKRPDVVYPFAQ